MHLLTTSFVALKCWDLHALLFRAFQISHFLRTRMFPRLPERLNIEILRLVGRRTGCSQELEQLLPLSHVLENLTLNFPI
jgi:hypothetical protein